MIIDNIYCFISFGLTIFVIIVSNFRFYRNKLIS